MKITIVALAGTTLAACGGGGSPGDPPVTSGASRTPAPGSTQSGGATPAPAATPTPVQTNGSAPTSVAYDPPAGIQPYFPRSPFVQQIPNPPTVNASSATWISDVASYGVFTLNTLWVYTSSPPAPLEIAFPVYMNHAGSNTPVKIHCTANFGGSSTPCNVEGMTVYIDPRMVPQGGGEPSSGDTDAHWALIDPADGYEYSTWKTRWPPHDGVLSVSWGGRCSLSGDGFTNPSYSGPGWNSGCAGDASSTPLSLGIIRAKDLLAALNTSDGTLPQALNYAFACNGTAIRLPAPFLGSGDGQCDGYPPEGSRLYLAMHDAQVNALGVAPIVAVILRTLDEDHYGAFIVDTGGRQPGLQLNVESDSTYTAWRLPGPWLTQFLPEARREGLPVFDAPSSEAREGIQLQTPPGLTWTQLRFL